MILPDWMGIVIALVYGTVVGSFLNVCIWRMPRDESIINPPSRCPQCNTQLRGRDLIPLFSFLIQRRKCRYCGAPITWRYFTVELLTGIFFVLVFLRFGWTIESIQYALLGAALIAIFLIDLEHYIIPDQLNIFGIVLGLARDGVGLATHTRSWHTNLLGFRIPLPQSVVGILICGGAFLALAIVAYYVFKKEALGGGDIKLAAAVGANLGVGMALGSFFVAVFLGTIIGLALIAMKNRTRKDMIPFGPFMVAGALVFVFFGNQMAYLWKLYIAYATGS